MRNNIEQYCILVTKLTSFFDSVENTAINIKAIATR